ncbi:L,D-transpeptidase [Nocardioides sp.]|uniref:L,D-transpeptidase n=1 Tax=Nocardioides sp. TaxID=35761 RepID=UPI002B96371C|nr:Ig-like domain-containing protein [Nocardioides sp.]HSX66629.1 Ig-like domain-containing protein [Nocardioides sp.]
MTAGLSRAVRVAAGLGALALLTSCNAVPDVLGGPADAGTPTAEAVVAPRLSTNVQGTAVTVNSRVVATAADGTFSAVTLRARDGETAGSTIPGTIAPDGTTWRAGALLEPATTYVVVARVKDAAGKVVPLRTRFATQSLEGHQVFPSVAPLAGETVGIGMPVIVAFDAPVADKARFEKRMRVTSKPAQTGAWHWLSDREVHWRPQSYWTPGTDVHVDLDLNSIPAGDGFYGQEDRDIDFHVGDAHVYKVNAQTHQMQVYSNGALLRTIPVTTGMPGFTTRSGTKVVVSKERERTMDAETTGIKKTDPEYYRVEVEYAMRLTYSGEFIHAAPWSVESQGRANVSHGCTGMSTENAAWLYAMTVRGDVVETVGTDVGMTLYNGYGDWNASFADWQAGSALT